MTSGPELMVSSEAMFIIFGNLTAPNVPHRGRREVFTCDQSAHRVGVPPFWKSSRPGSTSTELATRKRADGALVHRVRRAGANANRVREAKTAFHEAW